ncbi:hypothetical protein PSAC2689_30317 [Paraburkholderia sacchari]
MYPGCGVVNTGTKQVKHWTVGRRNAARAGRFDVRGPRAGVRPLDAQEMSGSEYKDCLLF